MTERLAEQVGQVRPLWFTVPFWLIFCASVFSLVGISSWSWWILVAVLGGVVSYCWWLARRPSRFRLLFAVACGALAVGACAAAAHNVFAPFAIGTESVGDNEVRCGSVLNPIPAQDLREVDGQTGEAIMRQSAIPTSEFERVCSNNLHYRTSDAVGEIILGVLLASRGIGHIRSGKPTREGV